VRGRIRGRSSTDHAARLKLAALEVRVRRAHSVAEGRGAVIGAGNAGLSVARTLHDHGAPTRVFEKARVVSGRAATRREAGGWSRAGPTTGWWRPGRLASRGSRRMVLSSPTQPPRSDGSRCPGRARWGSTSPPNSTSSVRGLPAPNRRRPRTRDVRQGRGGATGASGRASAGRFSRARGAGCRREAARLRGIARDVRPSARARGGRDPRGGRVARLDQPRLEQARPSPRGPLRGPRPPDRRGARRRSGRPNASAPRRFHGGCRSRPGPRPREVQALAFRVRAGPFPRALLVGSTHRPRGWLVGPRVESAWTSGVAMAGRILAEL
jgi:hypothetical protein